jgi:hypothetical protein
MEKWSQGRDCASLGGTGALLGVGWMYWAMVVGCWTRPAGSPRRGTDSIDVDRWAAKSQLETRIRQHTLKVDDIGSTDNLKSEREEIGELGKLARDGGMNE